MKNKNNLVLLIFFILTILISIFARPLTLPSDSKGIAPYFFVFPFTFLVMNFVYACFNNKKLLILLFPIITFVIELLLKRFTEVSFSNGIFMLTLIYIVLSIIGFLLGKLVYFIFVFTKKKLKKLNAE